MTQPPVDITGAVCPMPINKRDQIVIGHGSGGRLTHELIQQVFAAQFNNPLLNQGNDSAVMMLTGKKIAISTDAHIVSPLFFPGGDIGRLAICGTVNDVAMSGATPLYLTASFILEEGLPISILEKIVTSMQAAAEEAGVLIVAGDTKVVEKGKADQVFIQTSGVGVFNRDIEIGGAWAKPGDIVLISGSMGDHGIAVLSARGDLGFSANIQSDVAPLNQMIAQLLNAAPNIHVLRDPTRGGLATTLNEIARQSGCTIEINENAVPVNPVVSSCCEMLGFDPLYVANEGKLIVVAPPDQADAALAAMQLHPYGRLAAKIGVVGAPSAGRVLLKTGIGGTRLLDMLAGEMLPRIC